MEELTGFGKKNSLTLPSLANKYFNSLREENDDPIYIHNEDYMRYLVRQSIKGGRCGSFNQYFKSTSSDRELNIIPKELDVNGNICEILDKCFEFRIKHRKVIENDYDSQFEDYRKINQDERTKKINDKLNKLPIHEKLQIINLDNVMMNFDATLLYPIAMFDENSLYPKRESGFAFKPFLKKVYAEAFNCQTFNQDGNESGILRIKYYNPPKLKFQHLPVEEKVKNIEITRMRIG